MNFLKRNLVIFRHHFIKDVKKLNAQNILAMSRLILIKIVLFVSLCIALSAAFECGLRKVAPRLRRVIDGEQSYDGQWPWLVALLFRKSDESFYRFRCSATLINEWTVVTSEC